MSDFDKNSYQTPLYLFRWLERRYAWFHLDGCSNGKNALRPYWIGKAADGLDEELLSGQIAEDFLADSLFERLLETTSDFCELLRIFVNPPYSDPLPFVQRAAELKQAGYLVVMLLPADKSTKWYGVIQQHASEVIDIIGGRVNFINPVSGEEVKGNNKGSMIAVFDPFVEGLVTRQVSLDFIKQWGQ